MRELILDSHGDKGPDTTRKNQKSESIDRIWGTTGIKVLQEDLSHSTRDQNNTTDSYG